MSRQAKRSRRETAEEEERDETIEDLQRKIHKQAKRCATLHAKADVRESKQLEKEADKADRTLHYLQSAALPGGFTVHRRIKDTQRLLRELKEERERLVPQPRAIMERINVIDLTVPQLEKRITEDVQKLMKWRREDEMLYQ